MIIVVVRSVPLSLPYQGDCFLSTLGNKKYGIYIVQGVRKILTDSKVKNIF